MAAAWGRGLRDADARQAFDYRFGWYIVLGSIPIGVVGFLAKDLISGPLRSLWVIAAGLIVWSGVMAFAENVATQDRGELELTARDVLVVGIVQCVALVPGVSRSGATISAGLVAGLDRESATRLAFFLAIPALTAAGAYEAVGEASAVAGTVGWGPTLIGTAVSFFTAYASIAWLLALVARRPITVFIGYRVLLGLALIVAVLAGALSAT